MEQFPSSPDDVIDSRWTGNPQAVRPAPHVSRRRTPQVDLDAEMRAVINPWLAGDSGAVETLAALRDLADQHL
ncbi:hypothetical protein BJ986_000551 [Phycicoccus badiiscoriae]|uniref:Uncharacterized protein n=1 Tax=Pedococcus badiiscoriae TaxID=642776 RepID=A0A852WHD2_9MICO|nr:hypothetical protein [Pedococcus badiiscoriae]NYG06064.1 hypothetical protein [Pedococcus badiiscoriae]